MALSSTEGTTAVISPPEPDLTPEEMIGRAVALREKLLERQAETEERTYYSEEMHEEFQRAGFYRTYIPRRFGGYGFGLPTYARVLDGARPRVSQHGLVHGARRQPRPPDRLVVPGAVAGGDLRRR